MSNLKYKRIAVKIGSNVLTTDAGNLDIQRVEHLVEQVSRLHSSGVEVILVSSGAVASGREEISPRGHLDAVGKRQLFSAVGQARLMNCYYERFKAKGIVCGQVLTTKENFSSRRHYLNQKGCMEVMLESGVIPIVNENDTISVTELMFTDNDELSGLIATMMRVDALIILSNIDGIFNGNPAEEGTEVIRKISWEQNLSQFIQSSKSSFGRGGMTTKCRIARKVAKEGIPVIIANGKKQDILLDLLSNDDCLCTQFLPKEKELKSVKKWIAHSEDFAKGAVVINQGAFEALVKTEASSLLPVGVVAISGNFARHDIVRIETEDGTAIAVGKAEYDSAKARTLLGQKNQRPLVHYNYLYLLE